MVRNKQEKVSRPTYSMSQLLVDSWRHWDKILPRAFPENPVFKSYFGIEATRSTFNVALIAIGSNPELKY